LQRRVLGVNNPLTAGRALSALRLSTFPPSFLASFLPIHANNLAYLSWNPSSLSEKHHSQSIVMASQEDMTTESAPDQKAVDKYEPGAMPHNNMDNDKTQTLEVRVSNVES
jgi:hypothetical protein